jgi:ABC-type polar amino acid transport system ATPase subunit
MIQLQNISKYYGGQKVFKGCSVNIKKGERLVLSDDLYNPLLQKVFYDM